MDLQRYFQTRWQLLGWALVIVAALVLIAPTLKVLAWGAVMSLGVVLYVADTPEAWKRFGLVLAAISVVALVSPLVSNVLWFGVIVLGVLLIFRNPVLKTKK